MFRFVRVEDVKARRADPAVPVLAWTLFVLVLVPSQLPEWLSDRG
jgi:hypothetical protein